MKTTDTALLGHLEEEGTLYLSAVAVADLWTSSTGVFIQVRSGRVRSPQVIPQGRVLGTFVGDAVGAGKPEMAGVWTQVRAGQAGWVVSCLVAGSQPPVSQGVTSSAWQCIVVILG